MPSVNSNIDWGASLTLSWRLVEIDPSMWEPGESVGGVVSASVTRDVGGALLESGNVSVEVPLDYQPTEFWGRLEVIAEQGGITERWPVATMLMSPGDMAVNRGRKLVPYDCSSVLKAAADTVLQTGYSVPAGGDGAKAAAEILAAALPCPVYVHGSFTLDDGLVVSRGTSRLEAAQMLVDAAGWCIQVDTYGAVSVRDVPSEPSLVLDSSTESLLCTGVTVGGPSRNLPTVYIAVDGLQTARAEVASARPVEVYDDAPKRVNGETLQDYAERMLRELRKQTYSRSYRRAWVPGLTVFDVLDGNLPDAGLDERMHITSQRFSMGGEFVVEEMASVSPRGIAGAGIAAEIEKMLEAGNGGSSHMATVVRTDSNGITWISIPGGADETPLYGTFVDFEPGDTVQITIIDGKATAVGNATSPSVGQRYVDDTIVPVGERLLTVEDDMRAVEAVAEQAQAVADATGQHFWARSTNQDGAGAGAFVTDDERAVFESAAANSFPDWGDGTGGTKPYHNLLMNSLGILLRTALYNLVSITRSAIAFFDGSGNTAENVVARFGTDGAQIGPIGAQHAIIDASGLSVYDGHGNLMEINSVDLTETAAAAAQAVSYASEAADAADSAKESADKASYALSDVEKVVGTVNWIAEHGEYVPTEDVAVDASKVYYTRSGSGTQADPYVYSVVAEPKAAELSTYYELHIDESVQNYIASHLWLDDYGLNLSVDSANGYRVHQGTVDGTRSAGTYILDQYGNAVAAFGSSGAQIGKDNSYRTRFDEYGIEIAGGTSLFEVSSAVKQAVENQSYTSGMINYAYKGNFENQDDPLYGFGCHDGYAIFELPSGIKIYDEMRFVWWDAQQEISQFFGDKIYLKTSSYLWFTDETPVGPNCNWMHWSGIPDTVTGIMVASESYDYFYRNAFPLDMPTLAFSGIQHTWSYDNVSKPHMRFGTGTLSSSDDQAVFGRWNVEDTNDTYAVIVGNGSSASNRSDALTVDWSGNVACGTVNGVNIAAIGTTAAPVSTTTSVANSSNVNVASISLAAGTWIVCAKVQFPNNATGRRAVKLSTTSQDSGSPVSMDVQLAVSGAAMHMSTSRCFKLAAAGTVYLVAWQNSGGALSCIGDIEATRIS